MTCFLDVQVQMLHSSYGDQIFPPRFGLVVMEINQKTLLVKNNIGGARTSRDITRDYLGIFYGYTSRARLIYLDTVNSG